MKRRTRYLMAGGAAVAAGLCIFSAYVNFTVREYSMPYIFRTTAFMEMRRFAIVPGASVYRSGAMSHALLDRVETALQLYRRGKVRHFLLSGRETGGPGDEVAAMRRYLLRKGVAGGDIVTDGLGVSTVASMERASRVFMIKDAVVVTQRYHLYRAVMLARKEGIDAVGYPADRRHYKKIAWFTFREFFATVKDYMLVETCSFR